jgi:SLT domain-containing protein
MAQIYAAIHYAAAAYGGASMANVIGHGHGYSLGGPVTEPVVGYGLRTGDTYTIAEHGPEWITPGGSPPHGMSGAQMAALLNKLDQLIGVTAQGAAHVGGAITGATQSAYFRNRYPGGGA